MIGKFVGDQRMIVNLSAMRACTGRCSHKSIRTPLNGPPAVIRRGFGLISYVSMWRTARQPDENHRVSAADSAEELLDPQPQEIGQSQPGKSQAPACSGFAGRQDRGRHDQHTTKAP